LAEAEFLVEAGEPEQDYEAMVIRYIRACRKEAEGARQSRLRRNQWNLDAYHGRQDWSHKAPGQSQEFLPKISEAVEQFVAFIKRAMTDFGDWGSLDYPQGALPPGLEPAALWRLLAAQLNSLSYAYDEALDFPTLVADALKIAVLESLMVFKIHGRIDTQPRLTVERGVRVVEKASGSYEEPYEQLKKTTYPTWHLAIDLVLLEGWYPDPTGRKLYEIHRVERDLYEVQAMSEGPHAIYDAEIVRQIAGDFAFPLTDKRRDEDKGQDESTPQGFRKRVVLDEFWGTILDDDGRVLERNVLATLANDRYLIRVPEENPYWHGQSCFVACPLRRLPASVWHTALMDDAVALNLALNELHNLILDGGISAVWGINQLRRDWLERPDQVQDTIPYGTTLDIKAEVPPGGKVLEQVASGRVPQEALAVYQLLDREFQVAALTNDLKLGQLPPASTKVGAIVEAQSGQASLIDGIVRDVEDRGIEPTLRKAWLCVLQYLPDLPAAEAVAVLGEQAATILGQLTPPQRYALLGQGFQLRVNGLSAVLARARDFQKLLVLMQSVSGNPLLLQAFTNRYSADKIISRLFKSLNIDPESIESSAEERQAMSLMLQQAQPGRLQHPASLRLPGAGQAENIPALRGQEENETAVTPPNTGGIE
jgi:hypothetical protein